MTWWGAEEVLRAALMQRGSMAWVVGPTYPMLDHAERALRSDTALGLVRELVSVDLKRERKIYLCNGSLVEFRSAEWAAKRRGPGPDSACMDAPAGHIVVIGHDYVTRRIGMSRIAGNAVFLGSGIRSPIM